MMLGLRAKLPIFCVLATLWLAGVPNPSAPSMQTAGAVSSWQHRVRQR